MHDKTFLPFRLTHRCLFETADAFSSRLSAWSEDTLELPADGTHFGYVYEGSAMLDTVNGIFPLQSGMYFAVPSECRISGDSQGIVVTRLGYDGMFSLGGRIEARGRLRYIDGCTDSLIIPPTMCGDPCLNALYFPAAIAQTEHTHPSARIGLVVRGGGECLTPDESYALYPGLAFVIRAGARHRFKTTHEEMVVIAYHPDSDYGPTHEAHPMINRTMVDGVSASHIEKIRTTEEDR